MNSLKPVILALLAGFCWYVGNSLSGAYWYLVWLAPVPILLASFQTADRPAYWLTFGAALLGRLGWFLYLQRVMTTVPAVIVIVLLALAYAAIVRRTRTTVLRLNSAYALLTYPTLMTAYEFLLIYLSPDGSATSLAYSQADVLPLIQVASVAGLLGVTFVVSLFASAVAVGWYAFETKTCRHRYVVAAAFAVVGATFGYGYLRLQTAPPASATVPVGLVTLAEPLHYVSDDSSAFVARQYAAKVRTLAGRGARVVGLPEGALRVNARTFGAVMAPLQDVAQQSGSYVIVGAGDRRKPPFHNVAFVLDPSGRIVAEHQKVHLVPYAEARHFTPGSRTTTPVLGNVVAGVAICKDLDFPQFIRQYGRAGAQVLFVPANDFVVDNWLHSRMALLRSLENGLPMVRVARNGRLTVNDAYGRVLAETHAVRGQAATLLATVPVAHVTTFYTRVGDWLGALSLLTTLVLLYLSRARRPAQPALVSSGARGADR